jgi:HK97 family phage major capsid protein
MSYGINPPQESIKELRDRHSRTVGRMRALADVADSRKLTPGERDEFDKLSRQSKDIAATIKVRKDAKRKGKDADNRTEGRAHELLSRKQSMETWVNRAAENGVTVQTAEGGQVRVIGGDFDQNAYWGQRMGFHKPGAELRALGEDTSGSGQAITPQSWQAKFIDYLYPLTLMGKAGASRMPMETEIVNVPQFTAATQPVWAAENASTSLDATPAFAPVQFSAHGAFYDITLYSIELAQDAYISGTLPGMLAESMSKRYANIIDQAALYGITGNTGCPGFLSETGVNVRKYAGHTGTTGQVPADFSEPSILAETVRAANAEPNGFLTSPQLVGQLSRTNASTYAKYWEPPSDVADLWNNHTCYSTTIPVTETDPASGTNPAQTGGSYTSLYCGDFSRVVIGMRLDMMTSVLKERYIDQKQYGLFSAVRFSVRWTHPEAFVRSYGASAA